MTTLTTADQVISYLETHHLRVKHEPSGKIRCDSPFRPGADAHSFTLKADGEHGAWYDHVAGEGGSLYDLATRLGIPLPEKDSASYAPKKQYTNLAEYATGHGVAVDVFTAAGWRDDHWFEIPSISFPTANGTRHRLLNGKDKYKQPSGYQPCWYGLERAVKLAGEARTPLVLCNGEASVVVAQHVGIPAAAITNSGERPLPEHLLEHLRAAYDGSILVALDCDEKGRKAAPRLVAQLVAAGYAARAIDLLGSEHDDLADFCHLHGETSGADLLALPELEQTQRAPKANLANLANENSDTWTPPIAFTDGELPIFPVDVFPAWLRDTALAVSEFNQTPLDLAGMLGLTVLATAAAGCVEVEPKLGWIEPLNLFTLISLPPASRKSPPFIFFTKALTLIEQAHTADAKVAVAQDASRRKVKELELQRKELEAAKAPYGDQQILQEEADRLTEELAEWKTPVIPRYIVGDITPETLATHLYEQDGRIALLDSEADVFDIMAGRYSATGGGNLGVYLKGHSGDPLRIDRKNRPAEFVERPALTIGVTVQPDVLHGLSAKPGFRGKGLLGRFLFFCPRSTVGERRVHAQGVTPELREYYEESIKSLFNILLDNKKQTTQPHVLQFSEAARDLLIRFEEWLEPQLRETGPLGGMTDWAGKLLGATARIAALLHLADHVPTADWKTPIEAAPLLRAMTVAEYLIPHARNAFSQMEADPEIATAQRILRWIETAQPSQFNQKELFEAVKARYPKVSLLTTPLELLCERGYIRALPMPERSGPGRPPSQAYVVNPIFLAQNHSRNSLNSPAPVVSFVAAHQTIPADAPRAVEAPAVAAARPAIASARQRAERAIEQAQAGDFRAAKMTASCIGDPALRNATQVRIAEIRQPLSVPGY